MFFLFSFFFVLSSLLFFNTFLLLLLLLLSCSFSFSLPVSLSSPLFFPQVFVFLLSYFLPFVVLHHFLPSTYLFVSSSSSLPPSTISSLHPYYFLFAFLIFLLSLTSSQFYLLSISLLRSFSFLLFSIVLVSFRLISFRLGVNFSNLTKSGFVIAPTTGSCRKKLIVLCTLRLELGCRRYNSQSWI